MTTTVAAMSTPGTRSPEADGSLVARIVAGDDSALGHVYDRYGSLVYGLARRVTSSTAAAEEITQEVFVQFWEHADRFDAAKGSLRALPGRDHPPAGGGLGAQRNPPARPGVPHRPGCGHGHGQATLADITAELSATTRRPGFGPRSRRCRSSSERPWSSPTSAG